MREREYSREIVCLFFALSHFVFVFLFVFFMSHSRSPSVSCFFIVLLFLVRVVFCCVILTRYADISFAFLCSFCVYFFSFFCVTQIHWPRYSKQLTIVLSGGLRFPNCVSVEKHVTIVLKPTNAITESQPNRG